MSIVTENRVFSAEDIVRMQKLTDKIHDLLVKELPEGTDFVLHLGPTITQSATAGYMMGSVINLLGAIKNVAMQGDNPFEKIMMSVGSAKIEDVLTKMGAGEAVQDIANRYGNDPNMPKDMQEKVRKIRAHLAEQEGPQPKTTKRQLGFGT